MEEEDKLAARIRPLEALAAANPQLYRFRVALLALLGYAYLLGLVVLLLTLVAFTLYYVRLNFVLLKILWIPLVLAGLVLKSLWITAHEPDGKELQRHEAPALFDLVDEIRKTLNGPKVDHVLVNDEFNAAVAQVPQFGMFGWSSNYLIVGLPLMRAFSPDEFRAILAHELGHLSGKHSGWFQSWIYRTRASWYQVLIRVHEERSYAAFLFEPFLNWYAPYMNSYSFVLARAQELEADKYSVELVGKDTTALALSRRETKIRGFIEDFRPQFFRGANDQPMIPRDTFTQVMTGYEQPVSHTKAQRWLLEALREPTGYADTHPAFGDRLAAIGFQRDGAEVTRLIEAVVKANEIKESAATRYLNQLPDDFEPSMNRLWRERVSDAWNERHNGVKTLRKRLTELDEQAKTRALTVEEQWERVVALAETENREAAVPTMKAILDEAPDHVSANFALGRLLLEQGNADGIAYLERTIPVSSSIASEACELISGFYLEQGNNEMAETYRQRAEEHYKKALRFHEQATNFDASDKFAPHGLEESRVQQLQAQLAKVYGLAAAYLVRKIVDGAEQPLYVLAVVASYTWKDGVSGKHIDPLFEDLSAKVELPSPVSVLSLDGPHGYLLDTIIRIPGAQLYTTRDGAGARQ
ncbi:MAG TPA: M48 family metalloprotease [Pyrinomonadaceae bacterium]|nr:M48 family metalloprotease [Pyrinomonadaceae bacterium]